MGMLKVLLSGAERFLVGVIAFLRPRLLGRSLTFPDCLLCKVGSNARGFKSLVADAAGLDPMLFLGLPLPFKGEGIVSVDLSSVTSSVESLTIFLLDLAFGFGVALLLTGPSKDFLGLPRPRFATIGLESAPSFRGTVVVTVRSATRFEGEFVMAFSGSASTVTRIRQGLTAPFDLILDLEGGEDEMCGADGVVR